MDGDELGAIDRQAEDNHKLDWASGWAIAESKDRDGGTTARIFGNEGGPAERTAEVNNWLEGASVGKVYEEPNNRDDWITAWFGGDGGCSIEREDEHNISSKPDAAYSFCSSDDVGSEDTGARRR